MAKHADLNEVQGWVKRWSLGLVNFVPAVAYYFCLNLPAKFLANVGPHLQPIPVVSVLGQPDPGMISSNERRRLAVAEHS